MSTGQTGRVGEVRPDSTLMLTTFPENQDAVRTSGDDVGGGEEDGVSGASDGAGSTVAGGESEPTLDGVVETKRGEAEELLDTAPGPITRTAEESAESPWASRCGSSSQG